MPVFACISIVTINVRLIMLQHKLNERHQARDGRRKAECLRLEKFLNLICSNCFLLTKPMAASGWSGSRTVTEVIFIAITCLCATKTKRIIWHHYHSTTDNNELLLQFCFRKSIFSLCCCGSRGAMNLTNVATVSLFS